ncbi:DUF952 domain-containing protein [Actinacidiphila acidipaludis]|uniref:DUF952 domain-containing protein n=1 Tax=Actinacidiphila acidipaludis TaxID=2873382 RepID=A0ABS7Q2X6_9ACTN|nr:DUF952 domain-containing protein [Streptomyces acidipaludis]MBY8877496.1 DUF952 domain-containing protein [Streptomyces acidipaludis]
MAHILHLTERHLWDEARAAGSYEMSTRDRTLLDEGFIHCSLPHQLPHVAALLYGSPPARDDLVVLVIDEDLVDATIRYEPPTPGGEVFPHIYGPLPVSAVVAVESWPPTENAEARTPPPTL